MTKIEIRLTFDGPFNVGAGALGGALADKPMTRDARGLPVVPASTFKGRLRHEIERLAPVLHPGAPQHTPQRCTAPVAEKMCQGDGEPCVVCRLFGSSWAGGKLIFSDLTLVEPAFLAQAKPEELPPGDLRYGVGLSRHRRVAEDQLLYTTEVFMPGTPLTLSGTISGDLEQDELDLLRAGLDSLFALGGGKTRGMGWFDAVVTITAEPTPPPGKPLQVGQDRWLEVIVQPVSPTLLGTEANEAYFKTTRDYIPGSVLRGSLARYMMSACHHSPGTPHDGCELGHLFCGETEPVFEYLYPTTVEGREFAFYAPRTARSCKYHAGFASARRQDKRGHGVGDILIRQVALEHMLDEGKAMPALYKPQCPVCHADVKPYEHFVIMMQDSGYDEMRIPVRRTSRTAINRQRAVAADGQLYTLEMIEPLDDYQCLTAFRGRVRATPEQVALLEKWLPRLPAIGRKQSSGFGQVKIDVLHPQAVRDPLPPLLKRLQDFNASLRQEWEFYQRTAGVEPLPDGVFFFCLDLLSPASLYWWGVPVTSPPPGMLGFESGLHLERAFADYETLGGWHMGARMPRRTQLAAAMGSVFVYRSEGYSLQELAERLALLETNGIGNERARGFGRVLVCLPFHYQPEVIL